MDSDLSVSEQIDLMGASLERNLAVTVLLVNIILIIQGITILLFLLVIHELILSIVVGLLGAAILVIGFYALFGNIQRVHAVVVSTERLYEEFSDSSEKP